MKRAAALTLAALLGIGASLPMAHPATATPSLIALAITGRVSVTSSGAPALGAYATDARVLVDGTGRFAAFSTTAELQPDDANLVRDVYLRDRLANTTTRVSLTDSGAEVAGASALCGMSDDARYIGFIAMANNLQGGPTEQVYLRDRATGHTSIVSLNSGSVPANPSVSLHPEEEACPISADGRFVAFRSWATNLVVADLNNTDDVFRRDRTAHVTQRMSVDSNGNEVTGTVGSVSMSDDGSRVAWDSNAATLVAGDTNAKTDVFVRNVASSTTERVSLTDGDQQAAKGESVDPRISGDGTTVVFRSSADNLTPADTRAQADVFARSLTAGTTQLVSLSTAEAQATAPSYAPDVSDDGRFVTFVTPASGLYVGDGNSLADVYRRDRQMGTTDLVSRTNGIVAGNQSSGTAGSVSDDGSVVGFRSSATNLARDEATSPDAFVRDFAVRPFPFGSIDAFAKQQFADFAGRPPTPAELALWHDRVANGEWSLDSLTVSLAHSNAFSVKRAPLIRLYYAYFHRVPDLAGMQCWTKKLSSGTTLAQVAASFAGSSEFKTATGGLTNTTFVEFVYDAVLSRAPDAAGLAFWVKRLDAHTKSRGDLMVSFSESSEGIRRLRPASDSVLLYLGMLRRVPTANEFGNAWAAMALDHEPAEELAQAIRSLSEAYWQRF